MIRLHAIGVTFCGMGPAWSYAAGWHRAWWLLGVAALVNAIGLWCVVEAANRRQRHG